MLTYFLPGYNTYKIRTKQIPSGSNFLRVDVQNMLTLDDYSFLNSPNQWSYDECESIVNVSFNLDIALDVNVGDEYRIFLTPAITSSTTPFTYLDPIWHGSLQVFASQSVDKTGYVNQIPVDEEFISRQSTNEFVYWDQTTVAPTPTTTQAPTTTTTLAPTTTTTLAPTTTTTLAPTTTTLAPTTTTTAAPTTTTTAAPGGIDANFFFNRQAGGMGFDVCVSGSTNGNITEVAIWDYNLFMSSDSACTIPYGTKWTMTLPPQIALLPGMRSINCTSGGDISSGNYYRTRVSGSLQIVTQPGSVASPIIGFDISGSGYQDITFAGRTLRIHAAGCVLNDPTPGCP